MARDPRLTRRQALTLGIGAGAAAVAVGTGGPRRWRPEPAGAAAPVEVHVDPTSVVGAVPSRAVGLSLEKSTLALPLFTATNTPLVALFRLLGPGLLRLGGNSVERTEWDPHGPGLVGGVVSPPDLDRLAGFAAAVGWPVLYGTPFVGSTATSVADEAGQAADRLGPWLAGIELCNEPDLYVLDPVARALAGTYPLFRARWEQLADAVVAAAPTAVLSGPATCLLQNAPGWTEAFAADETGHIGLVTQHYYRGFAPPETIDELLADDPVLDTTLPQVAAAAARAGVGYRLAETNSFASGGAPGVSNTLASALWGVGLVLEAAAAGAAGVNIHTSGAGAGYPPFVQVNGQVTQIRPLFAGLQLAAGIGPGALVAATLADAPASVRAWAVRRPDATLAVALVNTDGEAEIEITIDMGAAVQSATAEWLTGPALDATTGVTFAGAAVGIDGSWTPGPAIPQLVSGPRIATTVAAASAGLITVTLVAPPTSTTSIPVRSSTPAAPDDQAPLAATAPAATAVTATPHLSG